MCSGYREHKRAMSLGSGLSEDERDEMNAAFYGQLAKLVEARTARTASATTCLCSTCRLPMLMKALKFLVPKTVSLKRRMLGMRKVNKVAKKKKVMRVAKMKKVTRMTKMILRMTWTLMRVELLSLVLLVRVVALSSRSASPRVRLKS